MYFSYMKDVDYGGYRVHDGRYFDRHDFCHLVPACWWFYFIWQKDFVDIMKANN